MDDLPVLDPTTLARLSAQLGGAEVVAGFVEVFTAEAAALTNEIAEGTAAGDPAVVAAAAHKLRSSSALLGLRRLSALCLDLERVARAGEMERLRAVGAEALTAHREAVRALGARTGE